MTTHSAKPEDKRTRILNAAIHVFAENGFFHSKVSDVAKAAGVADGTIYLYFKNKDDLLISLFENRMALALSSLEEAVAAAEGPEGKLRALIRRQFELVAETPEVAEVLTVELRQSSKFMKEYSPAAFADLLKLIAGIVREGLADGSFSTNIPVTHAARMLFGLLDEVTLNWLLSKDKFDITEATDWVVAFILGGLKQGK